MKKLTEIIEQLRKEAKEYHHQFGLLDYIEIKGLENLLTPHFVEIYQEIEDLRKIIDAYGYDEGHVPKRVAGVYDKHFPLHPMEEK